MFIKIGKDEAGGRLCSAIIWTVILLGLCSFFLLASASESFGEVSGREAALDVGVKTKVPADNIITAVNDRLTKNGGINITKDPLFNGMNNTFYNHSIDMPLTKFVLGNVELNASGIQSVFDSENNRRKSAGNTSNSNNAHGLKGTDPALINYDLSGIQTINANSGRVFRFLMGPLGAILLLVAFMCQVAMIGYNGLMHDRGFSAVPIQAVVFRLIIFLLAIMFFKSYVTAMITFSNYMSNAILSMETQTHILGSVISASATVSDGAVTIGSLIGNFFRALAYACVKILIIMRDVLMALTLVTGTTCIALGYFSTYSGHGEPMREYLSGWIKNFTTMLLWGPFASLVIFAMGVTSILTTAGEVSSVASGIFGLASLFAAKDIPKMSEEFGNIALASLISMLAPAVNKMTVGGAGGMTILAGSAAYRGTRGGFRKLHEIGDSYAMTAPIAGTMGGVVPAVMSKNKNKDGTEGGAGVSGMGTGRGDTLIPIAGTVGKTTENKHQEKKKNAQDANPIAGTVGKTTENKHQEKKKNAQDANPVASTQSKKREKDWVDNIAGGIGKSFNKGIQEGVEETSENIKNNQS